MAEWGPWMSDELVALVSRLVSYDSAEPDGVLETAGFIEGWLDSRGIQVESDDVRGLPVLKAEVGPEDAPTVVLHPHRSDSSSRGWRAIGSMGAAPMT
jgi:acetylornithine deacetylase/succinyl-diaminopimelate desuccinylase-like protein